MKSVITKTVSAWMLAVAALAASSGAQALALGEQAVAAKPHKKAVKTHASKGNKGTRGARAKFIQGSEETVAQRTARLKRECKGGVNAGACAGFTD